MMHISRLSYCRWHRCYRLACARAVCGKIFPAPVKWCCYGQLRNGQLFHSQFANLHGCRLVTVADEEISRRLCGMQTAGEILNFVSIGDRESWTPELSSLLTERLVTTHYKSLLAVYPWLQGNVNTASKQLRLGDTFVLEEAIAAVHRHPAYNTWMNIVEQNCASYGPDQLASALLSATNLFVDFDTSFVHRLLSETHRHLPEFSLTALAALSSSLKALPGNNDVLVRELMKRIQILLPAMDSVNVTELLAITSIFSHMKTFVSSDLQCQLVTWLLQMIETNKEVLLSPSCAVAFLHLGYIQAFSHKHNSRRLVDVGIETCQKYINQFTVADVARMCILLKSCVKSDESVHHNWNILESRALHLLSDDTRLSEVIDLMHCLTRHSSYQVVLQFYSALHSRLICSDYLDTFSLSSIAKILVKQDAVSTDLLTIVQRFIVTQADNIVPYPQLFGRIEDFLTRHSFVDKDLERQFNDRLLSYVGRYSEVSTKYATAVVSAYLLPVINDGLPTPVFKHVIKSVTHWHKRALRKHTLRMSSLRAGSLSSSSQLQQLNSELYRTLCKQLDLVDSLDCLHSVACSLLMHSFKQNPIVIDHLMHMYTQYSSALSDNISACKIATVFARISYHLPSVYDDLVHYVVSTSNTDTEILVQILHF